MPNCSIMKYRMLLHTLVLCTILPWDILPHHKTVCRIIISFINITLKSELSCSCFLIWWDPLPPYAGWTEWHNLALQPEQCVGLGFFLVHFKSSALCCCELSCEDLRKCIEVGMPLSVLTKLIWSNPIQLLMPCLQHLLL